MLLPYADGYGVPNEMTAPRDSRASALLLLLLATRPAASSLSESSSSAVRFANVFGDDMVLQAGSPAPVWGWAAPSAAVRIALSSGALNVTVQADSTGFWRAVLPSAPASMAAVDVFASAPDGSSAALRRVLFGIVVLCSGQSGWRALLRRPEPPF